MKGKKADLGLRSLPARSHSVQSMVKDRSWDAEEGLAENSGEYALPSSTPAAAEAGKSKSKTSKTKQKGPGKFCGCSADVPLTTSIDQTNGARDAEEN